MYTFLKLNNNTHIPSWFIIIQLVYENQLDIYEDIIVNVCELFAYDSKKVTKFNI